jgi:hypothetical protein
VSGRVFVCWGYRFFPLSAILILDFGILPTVWYFFVYYHIQGETTRASKDKNKYIITVFNSLKNYVISRGNIFRK